MIKNIMSVDLEDYYVRSPNEEWDSCESRILESCKTLLELFKKYSVRATFFTLGYVADRHPELIEEIVKQGHEIASHGYFHLEVKKIGQEKFEEDLVRSLNTLKKLSGENLLGYRAPRFSIDENSFWAFPILKKYLKYDSSIFPVNYTEYGISNAPTKIYQISDSNPLEEDNSSNFWEVPLATLHVPGLGNFPVAGGFYLRFLPISIIKYGINKINKSGLGATCYIHPHDLDPQKPKLVGYPWHVYWNLRGSAKKLESLLKNFKFHSVRDELSL